MIHVLYVIDFIESIDEVFQLLGIFTAERNGIIRYHRNLGMFRFDATVCQCLFYIIKGFRRRDDFKFFIAGLDVIGATSIS